MNYFTAPGLKNNQYPIVADKFYLSIEDKKTVVPDGTISPYTIMNEVCAAFQIQMTILIARTNSEVSRAPRQVAMYLMKYKTDLSLQEVGKKLGGFDHSTVCHAVKVVKKEIDTKSTMGNIATKLMQKL